MPVEYLGLLESESAVVWVDEAAARSIGWVRVAFVYSRHRTGRPRWPGAGTLVGYLELGADTPSSNGVFDRRCLILTASDLSHGRFGGWPPTEAVRVDSVGPRRWGAQAINSDDRRAITSIRDQAVARFAAAVTDGRLIAADRWFAIAEAVAAA